MKIERFASGPELTSRPRERNLTSRYRLSVHSVADRFYRLAKEVIDVY